MASLFPQMEAEPEQQPATSPPADLLSRARQAALQEMESMRNPKRQPQQGKSTLLTGHGRFV